MASRRRRLTAVALALLLPAAAALIGRPALAQEQSKSDQMEQMARRKFGALSNAELLLLRSAPEREIKWASPREDPDDPINDPGHGESWGPERTIRAAVLVWLCSDPVASRLVHPSGPGIIAARITGPLDLSYQNRAVSPDPGAMRDQGWGRYFLRAAAGTGFARLRDRTNCRNDGGDHG